MNEDVMDSNALVVTEGSGLPAVEDIDQAVAVYDKIRELAKERLVKDIDFGTIPGTNKPTLYQAGADKLNNFFGLSSDITTIEKELDPNKNWAYYKAKATLRSKRGGQIIAAAEASINSHESKYFYQMHPEQNPDESKRVYGSGYKKGQPKEPVRLPDLLNTLEAMAQKRALVKATRHAHGITDLYTQDTEDMPKGAFSGGSTAKSEGSTDVKARMASKFDNAKCNFCGERHINKGDEIVLVDGKWGVESCFLKKAEAPVDKKTGEVKEDNGDKAILADWIATFAKDHPDITEQVTENKDHRYTDKVFLMTFGLGWMKGKQAQLQQALDASN
jgi:hypothetical protein